VYAVGLQYFGRCDRYNCLTKGLGAGNWGSGTLGCYFADIVRSSLFYHQGHARRQPVSRAGYGSVHPRHLGRCSRFHWVSWLFIFDLWCSRWHWDSSPFVFYVCNALGMICCWKCCLIWCPLTVVVCCFRQFSDLYFRLPFLCRICWSFVRNYNWCLMGRLAWQRT
jgi:hypothetical protein